MSKIGLLAKYQEYLPITQTTPLITLGEGDTPLVRAPRLEELTGVGEIYFKLEGCNPTGSFKDRGMVMAIAKALEEGSQTIMCASTGNTSASAAAYAARCGLKTIILIPEGKIALGKLAQAIVHGASIVAVDGNFDQALEMVKVLTQKHPITLVNSLNPYRIEGQKTAAFEIIETLGEAPDYLFIPVGNAGNITAYWRGFVEFKNLGKAAHCPQMMGFQAEGSAPIVRGCPIAKPETVATAIRIGNPASWQRAVQARDESGGLIDMVSDEEILKAYHLMAECAGIFGEPASAAPLAGLIKMASRGMKFSNKKVVCVVTGTGLKDPDTAVQNVPNIMHLPPDMDAVERALGLGQS
ncbi:MAG: threonine synthase [Dehalococcoidia bacterium]|nr:threonine synthase [Dehalococcoidia bacterium]